MKLSNSSNALLYANSAGYKITEDGVLMRGNTIVNGYKNVHGYMCFSLRFALDGEKKGGYVMFHRLQAYQSFGMKMFEDGIVCRHLNSDKLDNAKSNIAIGTVRDNCFDNPAEMRMKNAINASSKLRRVSDETFQLIKADHEAGISYNKLREKYKVCKGTLSYMFNEARYNGLVPKSAKAQQG